MCVPMDVVKYECTPYIRMFTRENKHGKRLRDDAPDVLQTSKVYGMAAGGRASTSADARRYHSHIMSCPGISIDLL